MISTETPTTARTSNAPRRMGLPFRIPVKGFITFLPTIVAILFYGFFASDRYVSEAKIIIRTAAKPLTSDGSWGALLRMTGLSKSSEDIYAFQTYINSGSAVSQLSQAIPIKSFFGREEADSISRFPSFFYSDTLDDLHLYFSRMISSTFNSSTGILTLRAQAFRPEDAKSIVSELLILGEETVNRMNERIQNDAIRASTAEVKEFEERLIAAQIAITRFQNAELMIDPASSSLLATELIARLSAERTQIEAQIRETSASAPNSPVLPSLAQRATALEAQVDQERRRIADPNGGLADKLAKYERLVIEREFAKAALATATKGLEQARAEGRRQQLYLERIVEPNLPERPLEPQRLKMLWTVASLNMIGLLVGWLFIAGINQHKAGG